GRGLRALAEELGQVAARIEEQVRRSEASAREEAALKQEVDGLRARQREAQAAAQEAARSHEAATRELERERQAALARARRHAELEAKVQSMEARVQSLAAERARSVTALEDGEAELERFELERQSFLRSAAEQKE